MLAPREPSPAGPICSKREGFHPSYTSMIWNMWLSRPLCAHQRATDRSRRAAGTIDPPRPLTCS